MGQEGDKRFLQSILVGFSGRINDTGSIQTYLYRWGSISQLLQ